MNYYERHLGDYARAYGHFSVMQHGIYTLLSDRYYADEQGIPANLVYRWARADTDELRAECDIVLAEAFRLQEGRWVNDQIEADIARARVRIDAARANGKKGGRPTGQTQRKPSGLPVETQIKAHQAPGSKLQTPSTNNSKSRRASAQTLPRPDGVSEQTWSDWKDLRKAKRAPVTETVLKHAQAEASKAGMTLESFLQTWCARGSQGLEADWLKPHERGASLREPPLLPRLVADNSGQRPSKTMQGLSRLEALVDGPAASRAGGHALRHSAAADFRGKTYTGDSDEQFPDFLRPASSEDADGDEVPRAAP